MRYPRAAGDAARVALGAGVLLAPALINGFPFLYFDTESYYLLGQSILNQLPGMDAAAPAVDAGPVAAAGPPTADTNDSLTYAGGRSAYYSLLVRLAALLTSFWPVAVIQALLAAWLVWAAVRALRPARETATYFAIMAVLTLASSLPYFAALVMPDVFAGLAVLALTLLGLAPGRFGLLEKLGLLAVGAFSLTTHNSNLALAGMVLVVLLAIGLWSGAGRGALLRGGGWAAGALVLALGANTGYGTAVSLALGEAPHNPPYLMARVLADGPGRLYLPQACASPPRPEICRHAGKPLDAANDILWSADPARGVFMTSDGAGRRRMIAEERAFVLGAVAAHPGEQAQASAANSLRQVSAFSVSADVGLARASWDQMSFETLVPWARDGAMGALAYRGLFPFAAVDVAQYAAVLMALIFLGWRNLQPDVIAAARRPGAERSAGDRERLVLLGLSVGLVLVLAGNAVVCASLSGAFDRYQARVIWLLPLWGMLVLARYGLGPARAASA